MRVVLGPISAFPERVGVSVQAGGRLLAVYRVGDCVFALDDRCPHRGFPLADGVCDGATVRCRTHGSAFSLSDGALVRGPSRRGVRAYATAIEDGQVVAEID